MGPRVAAPRLRTAVVAAVVTVLLAACSDSPDSAGGPGTTSAVQTSATASSETPTALPDGGTTAAPEADFDGESLSAEQAQALQDEVDAGQQPWRLDQLAVAEAFVAERFGWTDVEPRQADPHTIEVTNASDGAIVVLQLRQPAREGADGIWIVVSGVRIA